MPKFPFTNYHELNLDWILKKVNALFDASEENARTIRTYDTRLTRAEQTATNAETAATSAQQLADAAAATAGDALSVAGTADAKADSALTAATDARNAAAGALTVAQEAQQTANNATATVNNVAARVDDTLLDFSTDIVATNNRVLQLETEFPILQADVENIKEELNTKADVIIDSASGEIASFSDGADNMPIKSLAVNFDPVQNLHGYEKPWPAGGNVNLCPNTGWTQGQIQSNGDQSASLVAISSDFIFLPSGTYILSRNYNYNGYTGTGQMAYHSYDMNKNHLADSSWIANNYVITVSNDIYIRLTTRIAESGTNISPSIIDNGLFVQLSTGSTTQSWTPYSNICPITGHTNITLYRTLNNIATNLTFSPGYYADDGSIAGSTASTTRYELEYMPVESGANYIIIGTSILTTNARVRLHEYSSNYTWLRQAISTIIPAGSNYKINYTPSTDAAFIRISIPLFDIPLIIGNFSSIEISWQSVAGTVYSASLDVISGILTVNKKMITYNGTENWRVITGTQQRYYIDKPRDCNTSSSRTGYTLSHFGDLWSAGNNGTWGSFVVGGTTFKVLDSASHFTDLAAFKTWLTDQYTNGTPLQIVYPLNANITYQLTPQQINTILGSNSIYSDVGTIDVKYPADTKLYIDGKIAELQALVLEN